MNSNKLLIILKPKKIVLLLLIVIFFLSIGINFYLLNKLKKEKVVIVKPQKVEDFALETASRVKKIMLLPQDENPQIFPVSANTSRTQDFVKDAKTGDILLLYLKNQKAILYDPLKNQILKVGPLTFSTVSAEPIINNK